MLIDFYFNRFGLVFISDLPVKGRKAYLLELTEDEIATWSDLLEPFKGNSLWLTRTFRVPVSGCVSLSVELIGKETSRNIKGVDGTKLCDLLMKYDPPIRDKSLLAENENITQVAILY